MKPKFFLAGALISAVVPGAMIFSGCGGGGGGSSASVPDLRFARQSNVEFPDAPTVSGVLTVNFADVAPNTSARAVGTLQLYKTPGDSANPIATPRPFPDLPPGVDDNFLSVLPSNATYILVGQVVPEDGAKSNIALDLRGSYQGTPRFTLRGNFVNGSPVLLQAKFNSGDSTLRGRIINVNNATLPTRPGTTTVGGATTTGATTTGATTTGATTTGATTTGATTTGATTTGATTTGATTTGATTAGGTSAGATTGATGAGLTMAGGTSAGATTGGTSVGLPPSVP